MGANDIDFTIYNDGEIQALLSQLKTYGNQLIAQGEAAEGANKDLHAAWHGEGAMTYDTAYQNFAQSLGGVVAVLADATESVDTARASAFLTDKKVGDLFL
ncbi:hypothetical protein ACLMAJ_17715 [Nocardia sp. KC 131]|uniref:hypothetical protein n=1 Tax=Nocardia arseniciresistens TaxID=3392119 RepID=UPI00398F6494